MAAVSNPGAPETAPDLNHELFDACRKGDIAKVKERLTHANANARDSAGRRSTPLHFAAGFGRRDIVELLLSFGASVDLTDDGGLTALHNAASFGHADVARVLLASGASAKVQDNWGFTPLYA